MRYFFHRVDGGLAPDNEGTECVDLEDARRQAVLYAAGTMRDNPDDVTGAGELRIEVTDHSGLIVTTVVIMSIDVAAPLVSKPT